MANRKKLKDFTRDPEWSMALKPLVEQLSAILKSDQSAFGVDRAVAITIAAHLERILEERFSLLLKNRDTKTLSRLFSERGPVAGFLNKIELAYAFGIVDGPMRDDLNSIRKIRNIFAHATAAISFDTDELAAECRKLNPMRLFGVEAKDLNKSATPRQHFVGLSIILMIKLLIDLLVPASQAALDEARLSGDELKVVKAEQQIKIANAYSQFFPLVEALRKVADKVLDVRSPKEAS